MIHNSTIIVNPVLLIFAVFLASSCVSLAAVNLPDKVKAVWDVEKAYREKTPTRERICINGLWRWQPADGAADTVPKDRWGYFKVPGSWPGARHYMQRDSQTVHAHWSWQDINLRDVVSAWYQREITIPKDWDGRRITLHVSYLNSYADIYLDGRRIGNIRFPGGEVDITPAVRPGNIHMLSMRVVAMPLKGVMLSFNDTDAAREVKGLVIHRGLCGDVYLDGEPSGARVGDVKIGTSVRKGEIVVDAALPGIKPENEYTLKAEIIDRGRPVKAFTSHPFKGGELKNGRITVAAKWMPEKLWDIHTPQNVFELQASLMDADGQVVDISHAVRFGFRELWIEGRDFYLNGSRIYLSTVPLDNAQIGPGAANYESARESLLRLKSFGINFVYTHNYGCPPGAHVSFDEILRAADDAGMLVSFSQPHFRHYEWNAPDADRTNGYADLAAFYVRAAQNHPSVVMYSMNHNATGYSEDMNPHMIDGIQSQRSPGGARNALTALRAEAVVKNLDPSRIVYHHSSGNLGSMHTSNFYPNFVPVQEMSDWFEHWATNGVKPLFTCEYAAPFSWDWTMYRGWYKEKRAFGSAKVPWDFSLAEWNAQFLGDGAFRISEQEKANIRWEAKQYAAGTAWKRWDYPYELNSRELDERFPIYALYINDNWRAFRTWGVSIISPWIHGQFWKLRDDVDKSRTELMVDLENLQRPGFSPDFIHKRYVRMDLAYERSDWLPTAAADALMRNNMPLLAYIAGKPDRFTSRDHTFRAGERVEKQIIIINNSREAVDAVCEWSLALPHPVTGTKTVTVKTGEQTRIPISFDLPETLAPKTYNLNTNVTFSENDAQQDTFVIHVLPDAGLPNPRGKIALFDPKGETSRLLNATGNRIKTVTARDDLEKYDILIVGRDALTVDGPAPDISKVRDGLRVIMFEQTADVLERRFGFRVAEYGLRQVFPRISEHPLLKSLDTEHMRDWRGEATILPRQLKYELSKKYGAPAARWCGMEVTRLWRCGNRGNVASVLIEKPAVGDFLPIVDGGFGLQYSPLLEYREGKGMVLFCQMDVTGRTETEPAAEMLFGNILTYVGDWVPGQRRHAVYVGDQAGQRYLQEAGIPLSTYEGGHLSDDHVLIAGPGAVRQLRKHRAAIQTWLKDGGNVLMIGADEKDAQALPLIDVRMKKEEHIAAFFEPPGPESLFAGIAPADVHNRDPRDLFLVKDGAEVLGNGVLARTENANIVFCQLAPWQFDHKKQYNAKRTYRRASFLISRLLANTGVSANTPILERFHKPVGIFSEKRWLDGLYLDTPEEWDYPYRFFRW